MIPGIVTACLVSAVAEGTVIFILYPRVHPYVWTITQENWTQNWIGCMNTSLLSGTFRWIFPILPAVWLLRRMKRYNLKTLLLASISPILGILIFKGDWQVAFPSITIAGGLSAYVFWIVTEGRFK